MATKSYRQAAILELIDRERVPSQEALRHRLASMGLAATQATISRDIKQLGLVKSSADGAYQRPGVAPVLAGVGEDGLRRVVARCLRRADHVQQFVVLKTAPGEAQMLAIALDRAGEAGVVGTVAGDDTILVITRDVRRARALAERFEAWARRESTREPRVTAGSRHEEGDSRWNGSFLRTPAASTRPSPFPGSRRRSRPKSSR